MNTEKEIQEGKKEKKSKEQEEAREWHKERLEDKLDLDLLDDLDLD